jgi:nucleoid-associated protein YejK
MTKIDTGLLKINKIVIHDVPKHKMGDTSILPIFSEHESEISDVLRMLFKEKISSALQKHTAFRISYDTQSNSPVPLFISKIMQKEDDFISLSKQITQHLYDIQNGNNSAGIVMIIMGIIKQYPICVILKLERDKGAQLKLDTVTKTFNATEIENLMLTEKSRMYKVALLVNQSDFDVQFDGMIFDFQNKINNKKDLNTFFMSDFLGCKPFQEPRTTTKKFYELTYAFIDTIEDPITKIKYFTDLNSYLQKNQSTICPKEFAQDYFQETQHKNDYKIFLTQKEFLFESFVKDTDCINAKIKKLSIDFVNGISIVGTNGVLDDRVKLTTLDDGEHKAEIKSKIKEVK